MITVKMALVMKNDVNHVRDDDDDDDDDYATGS